MPTSSSATPPLSTPAQGLTADVMHGIVTGEESRQTLYTMLTRGRIENHVHVVLAEVGEDHALPSPTFDRQVTATELLEDILARDGAAVSATTTHTVASNPEAQLHDAVTRYADGLALAATQVRVDFDGAPVGPLPWLVSIPSDLADHPAWGPYLTTRARRVSTLADEVRARPALPEWTSRYDDVLTPALRGDLVVWRAAVGVKPDDRALAGPPPTGDRETAYHRYLIRTVNARYGDVLQVWETRIIDYVGRRDEHTVELAKKLDELQRKGADAEQVLDLAAARKPLPTDHPTAALAYRVRELVAPKRSRRKVPSVEPFARSNQQPNGPSVGL